MLAISLIINDRQGSRLVQWLVDYQLVDCLNDAKRLAVAEATVMNRDAYIELEDPIWLDNDERDYLYF